MTAEEALHLGEPCAHAVEYYERKRLDRIAQRQRAQYRLGAGRAAAKCWQDWAKPYALK